MTVFFSICIPQYNRTDFLIEACRSFQCQTFQDFEVCISDDCSNDGKDSALTDFLSASEIKYVYRRNSHNLRYDGNLRSAISLSTGKYVLLMGNDDGLSGPYVLEHIRAALESANNVVAAITNYREVGSGEVYRRIRSGGIMGTGPGTAVEMFRNYSFVSGIIFDGSRARALATNVVDGSEMYQMYLGARLVSEGGNLLGIDEICIEKDLQIAGLEVDSYQRKPRLSPCPIIRRRLPMTRLLEVVDAGVRNTAPADDLSRLIFRAACRLYMFTYPFWGIEYRRVQSWRYAFGLYLALSPDLITRGTSISPLGRLLLYPIYWLSMVAALATPIALFAAVRPVAYRIAKMFR